MGSEAADCKFATWRHAAQRDATLRFSGRTVLVCSASGVEAVSFRPR